MSVTVAGWLACVGGAPRRSQLAPVTAPVPLPDVPIASIVVAHADDIYTSVAALERASTLSGLARVAFEIRTRVFVRGSGICGRVRSARAPLCARAAEFAAHICLDKRDEQIKSNDL